MSEKPKILNLYAMFFFAIALAFPVQIMFLYDLAPIEIVAIAAKLSVLNLIVMVGAILNGILIYRASPKIRWLLPMLFIGVLANNVVVGVIGADFSLSVTGVITVIFGALLAPLYQRQVYSVFQNPQKRWWMAPKRVRAALNMVLTSVDGKTIEAKTFDISTNGTFVPLQKLSQNSAQLSGGVHDWEEDDDVSVTLSFDSFRHVRCRAKVVRINKETSGRYPPGLGLRFEDLDRAGRSQISGLV